MATSAEGEVPHDDCLTSIDAVGDILLLASGANKASMKKGSVEITMDSGAAEVVAPPGFAPDYHVKASAGSRAGAKQCTASGSAIAQGENRVTLRTESGELRTIAFQIANVTKPLASAGRITGRGHRIVLDDDNAHILRRATNRKFPLYKKGTMFVTWVSVMPPETTQKDKAAVLGVLGFTRQED